MAEGILVTPSMLSSHRMYVLREALESATAGEAATEAAAADQQVCGMAGARCAPAPGLPSER
jgi:hypothetical protein